MTHVARILALDPSSTSTGYAVFDGRALSRCGTLQSEFEAPLLRCLDMADGVEGLFGSATDHVACAHGAAHVIIEIPGVFARIGRGAALATYGMAVGCVLDRVQAAGYVAGQTLHGYTPGQWMKGMQTKEKRYRFARSLWPHVAWPAVTGRKTLNYNNDAGDAALLGWWWMDSPDGKRAIARGAADTARLCDSANLHVTARNGG